jgi:hypothetical protein
MRLLMRYCMVFFFILLSHYSSAQDFLSKEKQLQDLDQLYFTLLSEHPAISNASDSAKLLKIRDSIETLLNDDASEADVLKWFSRLVNSLGCGHTHIQPPTLKLITKRLPVRLKWIENKAIVIASKDNVIPAGAEVVNWHGLPIERWLDTLCFVNSGVDNNLESVRKQAILNELTVNYNYLYKSNKLIRIKYRYKNSEVQTRTLEFEKTDNPSWIINSFDPDEAKPFQFYKATSSNTIYLKINTFMPEDTEESMNSESLANELKQENFDNIVIDLRGNLGGSAFIGQYFLGYFLPDSAALFDTVGMRLGAKQAFNKKLVSRLLTSGNDLPTLPNSDWIYKNVQKSLLAFKIKKDSINFSNKRIFVLIDRETFSCAPSCALILKNFGATLIGEESGGRGYLNYALSMQTKMLKKSNFIYGIPIFKATTYSKAKVNYQHNLVPDYEVQWTVQDVLNEKDPCLEKVKELIRK